VALSIIACVFRSTNRLVYELNQSGNANPETIIIPNDGGATPDLQTDALAGVQFGPPPIGGLSLYRLLRARNNGWGPLPAGALDQGQARALLLGWDQSNLVITNPLVQYATTRAQSLAGTDALAWSVDADVDAQGDPVLVVESNAFGSGFNRGLCLIEIELRLTLLG